MNGFLGTGATIQADLNLSIQFLIGIVLLCAMFLARKGYYRTHGVCQESVILFNLVLIALIMVPSFRRGVVPELQSKFVETYYFVLAATVKFVNANTFTAFSVNSVKQSLLCS